MKKWIIALAASVLTGCGEEAPKALADLSRDITGVASSEVAGKKLLEFSMRPSSRSSNANYFFQATSEINHILPKLLQYFPEERSDLIFFTLSADLTDKFGNVKGEPVIQVSFKAEDVKKINYKGGQFSSWSLLNLANNVEFLHPAGSTIVSDYCQDKDSIEYAHRFCQRYN